MFRKIRRAGDASIFESNQRDTSYVMLTGQLITFDCDEMVDASSLPVKFRAGRS
jgi:hypothetical protein